MSRRSLGMDPPLCLECDSEMEVDISDDYPPKMVTRCPECEPVCVVCGDDVGRDGMFCGSRHCEATWHRDLADLAATDGQRWRYGA